MAEKLENCKASMEPLIHNPYKKSKDGHPLLRLPSSASTGQEQADQQEEIQKSKNSFAVMMNASRQQALQKKRKAGDPPIGQLKKQATARSVTATAAAASRTANKKRQKEQQADTSSGASGDWQKH